MNLLSKLSGFVKLNLMKSNTISIICIALIAATIHTKLIPQIIEIDALYNFNPRELSDSFFPLLDWELDAAFYFEVDTNYTYDIEEIHFQFISDFEFWWGPLPYTFPLTFRIGSLDTIPYPLMELWPTQNTGDPSVDIWSALPGEEIATLDVTINDSAELYPNWKIVELDTIASMKNLIGNFWVTASVVLYRTAWDSIPPSSYHTFTNVDNGYWINGSPDRAIKVVIEKTMVGIEEEAQKTPSYFYLHPNYPNPFNATTVIPYTLSAFSDVRLVIYDLLGKEIYSFRKFDQSSGTGFMKWNGTDSSGKNVPSGIYFYTLYLKSNMISHSESGKVLLLR